MTIVMNIWSNFETIDRSGLMLYYRLSASFLYLVENSIKYDELACIKTAGTGARMISSGSMWPISQLLA